MYFGRLPSIRALSPSCASSVLNISSSFSSSSLRPSSKEEPVLTSESKPLATLSAIGATLDRDFICLETLGFSGSKFSGTFPEINDSIFSSE